MVDTSIDIAALRQHIGTKIIEQDVATPVPIKAMAATFDRDEPEPVAGTQVPPGWHHAYFLPMDRKGALGPDGMPLATGVIPAMPLPRRMFAGVRIAFPDVLRIGDALSRETELIDIQLRQGASGTLVFTTQLRRIFTPRGLAVEEHYEGVFREAAKPGETAPAKQGESPPANLPWQRSITPDAVSLFRFSALTFNPHRIHYDKPYAMNAEGYVGLVVHGPFVQQCLMDFARDHMPGKSMASYAMRAKAPLFDTGPFTLQGRPNPDNSACELWAVATNGTIAMQANATFTGA